MILNRYILFFSILLLQLVFSCEGKAQGDINQSNPNNEEYFTNPIISSGADTWMIYHDGYYYFSESDAVKSFEAPLRYRKTHISKRYYETPQKRGHLLQIGEGLDEVVKKRCHNYKLIG